MYSWSADSSFLKCISQTSATNDWNVCSISKLRRRWIFWIVNFDFTIAFESFAFIRRVDLTILIIRFRWIVISLFVSSDSSQSFNFTAFSWILDNSMFCRRVSRISYNKFCSGLSLKFLQTCSDFVRSWCWAMWNCSLNETRFESLLFIMFFFRFAFMSYFLLHRSFIHVRLWL